ncbi:MAG: adenylate kinase, partial [Planctomycetota bacterium]
THLDELHWRPGWVEAPRTETAAAVAGVVARPAWVIDGNYGDVRRCHLDEVDLFVWLDLPLTVTFPRLVRRCFVRSWRRQSCCNGNVETLRGAFLHPDSILLWALTSHRRHQRQLTEELARRPHVRLRSRREVARWLARGGPAA